MTKIAIIVQRYGKEINGGAEVHARLLAEHLTERYEVDVLTSCSLSFPIWDNHYPAGEEVIDNIRVLRFTHEANDPNTPHWLGRYLRGNWKYYNKGYTFRNFITLTLRRIRYRRRKDHDRIFERWIENDGPICKDMIAYIEQERNQYEAFIFINYPFYPTYFGLQKAVGRSILLPLAHDEPMLYLSGYEKMFALPRFILYNTESERLLVESAHPVTRTIRSDVAGVGFDKPRLNRHQASPIRSPYFVYIGRIDIAKGCLELIDYFLRMDQLRQTDIKLVMIGNSYLKVPVKNNRIIFTGFIDEEEKRAYLQHCEALIIPSRHESLSMVTLEAMADGKPVLANGHSEVLRRHIEQSEAGFVYYDENEFGKLVSKILNLSDLDKKVIAQKGRSYVERNYQWDCIVKKFEAAIDYLGESSDEAPQRWPERGETADR